MIPQIFASLLIFCYVSSSFAEELSFESPVTYKKNEQSSFVELKSGEKLLLDKGDNVFVLSKQNIPILIYSANKRDATITISDASINAGVLEMIQPYVESSTSEIIEKLRKAEALMQKRDYAQASQIVGLLKQKYKNNSSVLFMNASIRYLLNDKSAAIEDLQKGLIISPNDDSAKKLLAKLKGGL